jgi:hypothetical protein
MIMKQHILAAMREEFDAWEALLGGLSEAEISAASQPEGMSVKDFVAHVRAWQQRTIARVEAAQLGREPQFPDWSGAGDPDADDATDQINAWIYQSNHDQPWPTIHENWRSGYLHLLQVAETISERDLLDSARYSWLKGYPLAFILVASYDHHQEHLEQLQAWFQQ